MSSTQKPLPDGVFPTMITPFTADGSSIDYPTLDKLIEWYIASGVSGLFAVCQSSEMYNLSDAERLELAKHVMTKANGRVSVVASGTFGGPIADQAAFVTKMGEIVDAVVVLVNQLAAKDEGDEVWVANVKELLSLTGNVPLGLYECPQPYHRLLQAPSLKWCAESGRFLFHKDTCCKTQPIVEKINAVRSVEGSAFRFYNANMAMLRFSIVNEGSGFSGIAANFYPQLISYLCANPHTKEAIELQKFMAVAENVVMYKYPRSAKVFLNMFEGLTVSDTCRNGCAELNEEETLKLESLHSLALDWCDKVGVKRINPATGKECRQLQNSLD